MCGSYGDGIGMTPIGYECFKTLGGIVSTHDKAKNAVESAKGKTKEAAGRVTDDRSLEARGKAERAKGHLKQAGENVKDAVKR